MLKVPAAKLRSGFTLLELILAVGIMAIVLAAINAIFFSALRLRDRTVAAVDESLPIERTLAIMRRDLEGAMAPTTNGILAGDFKAGNVTSIGVNQNVNLELFTTTGVLRANDPWGDVQKVTYELKPSSNRKVPGQDLYRSVTRNLLATDVPQPDDQFMMNGVQSIEFSCYDGTQWRDDWDTTVSDTNLPTAVRVIIQLAAQDGSAGGGNSVQMTVPLDMQPQTDLTQQ